MGFLELGEMGKVHFLHSLKIHFDEDQLFNLFTNQIKIIRQIRMMMMKVFNKF